MINKAFLHPAIRARMDWIIEKGRAFGLDPEVTSGWRTIGVQRGLFQDCLDGTATHRVKHPGCSQHEFGFAFDMLPRRRFPRIGPRTGGGFDIDQSFLQEAGRVTGLTGSGIHFAVFPAAVWDPHMTRTFGVDCSTCTPRKTVGSGVNPFRDFGVLFSDPRQDPRSFPLFRPHY